MGLESWGRVVRFGWRLEQVKQLFFHASVSYRPLALIFLKNKDALDKRVALNSVHAQRAQPFPDSSTQHY